MNEPEFAPAASFIYSFSLGDDDPALSRLPEEVRDTAERLIVDVIYEAFVTSADEDYLAARVLAVKGLPRSFSWGAGQALEKYFKGFLLFRGQSVRGEEFNGHPIKKLFNCVVALDPSVGDINMVPHQAISAELLPRARALPIPLPEFIDIIQRNGSPNNRYNASGIDFDIRYIFALDSLIAGLRTRIGAPPIEFSFKNLDEDILAPFRDNNPYFWAFPADGQPAASTHSFRLLGAVHGTTQEYLRKTRKVGPPLYALNWLKQRMRIVS